jgi:hypothetical protein
MAKIRTYVKHLGFTYQDEKDIDSRLDALILSETNTGAVFKAITSSREEGYTLFTLVFERTT